jgi:hypothetical protein
VFLMRVSVTVRKVLHLMNHIHRVATFANCQDSVDTVAISMPTRCRHGISTFVQLSTSRVASLFSRYASILLFITR